MFQVFRNIRYAGCIDLIFIFNIVEVTIFVLFLIRIYPLMIIISFCHIFWIRIHEVLVEINQSIFSDWFVH